MGIVMNSAIELEEFGKAFLDALEEPNTNATIIQFLSGHSVPRVGHNFETSTNLCFEALKRAGAKRKHYKKIAHILKQYWKHGDQDKHQVMFLLERFSEFPKFQLPIYRVLHDKTFKNIYYNNKDELFIQYHHVAYCHNIEAAIKNNDERLTKAYQKYEPKKYITWRKKQAQEHLIKPEAINSLDLNAEEINCLQILHLETQAHPKYKQSPEKFSALVDELKSKYDDYQEKEETAQLINTYNQLTDQKKCLEAADIKAGDKLHKILAPGGFVDLKNPIILFLNEQTTLQKSVITQLQRELSIQQAHIHEKTDGRFAHGYTMVKGDNESIFSDNDYNLLRRNQAYRLTQNQYDAWLKSTPKKRVEDILTQIIKTPNNQPKILIDKVTEEKNRAIELAYSKGSTESPHLSNFARKYLHPHGYSYNILHGIKKPYNLVELESKNIGTVHIQFVDTESNELLPENLTNQCISLFRKELNELINIDYWHESHPQTNGDKYLWTKIMQEIIAKKFDEESLKLIHHFYLLHQGTKDILKLAGIIGNLHDNKAEPYQPSFGFVNDLLYFIQRGSNFLDSSKEFLSDICNYPASLIH